ncbi:MAG: hypothetical protein CL814_14130 [Confluentimicrobium sp.]|jgi:sulfotransferase 6B1|nr:hypothetical protein [Actibacterium sp.]|tara:strand:+ start:2069 stop:2977 length:909 start_codon:yes stop_codon:yes gene_type:complete
MFSGSGSIDGGGRAAMVSIDRFIDHPRVRDSAPLRKGLAFIGGSLAALERMGTSSAAYVGHPPIFANSLPKSGTHLLLQVTRALPGTRYLGRFIATSPSLTQVERSLSDQVRRVERILPSETLGSHLYHSEEVSLALERINALHLFIYRDPRDVIVSEAHYLGEMNRWHRMHKHFAKRTSARARLELALDGLDDRYPECNARLLPYAGWLDEPRALTIRYEDIAGENRHAVLEKIVAGFVERGGVVNDHEGLVHALDEAIDPKKSHTFRTGGTGKWRNGLTDQEADYVTARLRPSLDAFGYA